MEEKSQNTGINGVRLRDLLEAAGVRCTRQRLLLANIMFEKPQHLSAEQVMALANRRSRVVSKATVYNTLGLFARMGLVREVIVDPQRIFYDSNVSDHHHVYNEDEGTLCDIALDQLKIVGLPEMPPDTEIRGVEVIVRVQRAGEDGNSTRELRDQLLKGRQF